LHYALAKKLDFKAQTRLWVTTSAGQPEQDSADLIETPVQDDTKTANDLTPFQAPAFLGPQAKTTSSIAWADRPDRAARRSRQGFGNSDQQLGS